MGQNGTNHPDGQVPKEKSAPRLAGASCSDQTAHKRCQGTHKADNGTPPGDIKTRPKVHNKYGYRWVWTGLSVPFWQIVLSFWW